jgi:hypothetical protein
LTGAEAHGADRAGVDTQLDPVQLECRYDLEVDAQSRQPGDRDVEVRREARFEVVVEQRHGSAFVRRVLVRIGAVGELAKVLPRADHQAEERKVEHFLDLFAEIGGDPRPIEPGRRGEAALRL